MKARPTASKPPLRKRDEVKALFRDGILDAAEVVFARRGFHAARIQDIAEEARIAIGTVYNHFDTKDDVLRALLEERTEALVSQLRASGDEPTDYVARLQLRIERLVQLMARHRNFFSVAAECGLLTQPSTPEMSELVGHGVKSFERFKEAFRALVREGIDSGALAPHDPKILAAALGGMLRALTFVTEREDPEKLATIAPTVVKLFLHGAAAPAPTAKTREHRR